MRYFALATDYDGTLAHKGQVDEPTLAALARWLASGRRLILVTGRQLDDLRFVFPPLELFEWIVAENGAVLYCPSSRLERLLAAPPSTAFVELLNRRGVHPVSVGRAIVATDCLHEKAVLGAIGELGLGLQLIFNKEAIMVLPEGVSKASGVMAALAEMRLSPENVVGVGDAENDRAFLELCGWAAAVANALPAVKEHTDRVMAGARGAGVTELINELIATDCQ